MSKTLDDLINCLKEAIRNKKKYVGTKVQFVGSPPTVKIVPKESFLSDIRGYKMFWNDNLTFYLDDEEEEKIIDFASGNSYAEIEEKLNDSNNANALMYVRDSTEFYLIDKRFADNFIDSLIDLVEDTLKAHDENTSLSNYHAEIAEKLKERINCWDVIKMI